MKICETLLLNQLQDRVALFNVAPFSYTAEEAWCTPQSHYGLRYEEKSCPQSSEDVWFNEFDYELFILRETYALFTDTLGHLFNQPEVSLSLSLSLNSHYRTFSPF